jgi:transcriptional regulator with XRE-family HTH domain
VLGEVERGNRVPSEDLVQSIAQELNITVEELIPPELKREEVNN